MRSFILTLLMALFVLVTGIAHADTLAQLHKSFMERYDAANLSRDEQLKKLDAAYLAALNRQVEKAKATGKLDAVIPILDEEQAVKNAADSLPELPATASPELKQMRAKHAEARAKILKSHAEAVTSLADKMTAALKDQESELTKAGKIDDALAAKHMRESLEKDEQILASRSIMTEASLPGKTTTTGWIPFSKARVRIIESQFPYVGQIGEKGYETTHAAVRNAFDAVDAGKRTLWVMLAPAKVEIRFERKVSEIKAETFCGNPGISKFKITTPAGIAIEQASDPSSVSKPLDCKFPPTDRITIEIVNESSGGNWTALIDPRAR